MFGWSLGGHIGIEMVPRFSGIRGLMITGSPPVGRNNMAQGFNSLPQAGAGGKQDLPDDDIEGFVQTIFGESAEPFLCEAVARTDGHFRKRLFEAARGGEGVDQRQIVESSSVPLAVVSGGVDRIVNLEYFDTVAYANLWEGRCHRLAGLGHAPFWEAPSDFDPFIERFLQDVETSRVTTRTL